MLSTFYLVSCEIGFVLQRTMEKRSRHNMRQVHTYGINFVKRSLYVKLFIVIKLAELAVGLTVELEVEETAVCQAPSTSHGLDHFPLSVQDLT